MKKINSKKIDIFDPYYRQPDTVHKIWEAGEWLYCLRVVAEIFSCSLKEAKEFCETNFKNNKCI